MNITELVQTSLSWALTYSLHSTALLLLTWAVTRTFCKQRYRLREYLWKTAIVGGLFTASLQVGLDVAPLGGRIDVGEPAFVSTSMPGPTTPIAALGAQTFDALEFNWRRLLVGAWALGGALGVLLLALAWRRIADIFHGRRRVPRGATRDLLTSLAERAGLSGPPRLTASNRLRSPATIGVFFPQICVPYRALRELGLEEQEALLAHELAHILRRDPLWFFLCRLIERVLFFQPLNRLARVELEETAEFLADDWAIQATGDELSLARCLTEVATWVLGPRPIVAVVPMASQGSRLSSRVSRLLDDDRRPQVHGPRPFVSLACAVLLGVVVVSAPGAAALSQEPDDLGELGAAPTVLPAAFLTPRAPLSALPEPAPAPAPAPATAPASSAARLDVMLERLDAAVVELANEVESLGRELDFDALSPADARTASDLGARVRTLQARRVQLQQIMPELTRRLNQRSASDPTNSKPLQEGPR